MPFTAIQSRTTWNLLKKFYTHNQGWILEEANQAIASVSLLSEMPQGPFFSFVDIRPQCA